MRFESSIVINASAEKVWALIDRLEEWPQWMPSIKKIERISQGPLTVGRRGGQAISADIAQAAKKRIEESE